MGHSYGSQIVGQLPDVSTGEVHAAVSVFSIDRSTLPALSKNGATEQLAREAMRAMSIASLPLETNVTKRTDYHVDCGMYRPRGKPF